MLAPSMPICHRPVRRTTPPPRQKTSAKSTTSTIRSMAPITLTSRSVFI
jgi:hypothetical protein